VNEEMIEPYLSKARECLFGAESELANGRFNNATNRAYYAAYNAAIVALIRAGMSSRRWDTTRCKHCLLANSWSGVNCTLAIRDECSLILCLPD